MNDDMKRKMTSDHTARLVRDLYRAFAAADLDAAAKLVRDDCVVHVPGIGANAGDYWGRDGFRRFMTNIFAYNGGAFDMRVPVLSVNGTDAFTREVIMLNRIADPDQMWTLRFAMQYRWKAGGLSEVWVVPEDQRLYDEYWMLPIASTKAIAATKSRTRPPSLDLVDIESATSDDNLTLLRRFYDLFFRGDLDELEHAISKDVIVNITGRGDLSGMYYGWDGYMQFRHRLVTMIGSKYKLEIDTIAAGARDGWVKEYIRMDRTWDRAIATSYVLMHFEIEDGVVVTMDDFPVDPYAWEREFSFPNHLGARPWNAVSELAP